MCVGAPLLAIEAVLHRQHTEPSWREKESAAPACPTVIVNGFSRSKFITATWADNQTLPLDSHCLSLRAGVVVLGQVGLCSQSGCTRSMRSFSGTASTVAPSIS